MTEGKMQNRCAHSNNFVVILFFAFYSIQQQKWWHILVLLLSMKPQLGLLQNSSKLWRFLCTISLKHQMLFLMQYFRGQRWLIKAAGTIFSCLCAGTLLLHCCSLGTLWAVIFLETDSKGLKDREKFFETWLSDHAMRLNRITYLLMQKNQGGQCTQQLSWSRSKNNKIWIKRILC